MSQSSDGDKACSSCRESLLDSDRFCSQCGHPRIKTIKKQCLLCAFLIPDKPECVNCLAPQDRQKFENLALKPCVNSKCSTHIMPNSLKCYKCNELQNVTENSKCSAEISVVSMNSATQMPSNTYQSSTTESDTVTQFNYCFTSDAISPNKLLPSIQFETTQVHMLLTSSTDNVTTQVPSTQYDNNITIATTHVPSSQFASCSASFKSVQFVAGSTSLTQLPPFTQFEVMSTPCTANSGHCSTSLVSTIPVPITSTVELMSNSTTVNGINALSATLQSEENKTVQLQPVPNDYNAIELPGTSTNSTYTIQAWQTGTTTQGDQNEPDTSQGSTYAQTNGIIPQVASAAIEITQGPVSFTSLKDNVNAPTSTTSHSTHVYVTQSDADSKTMSSTSTETSNTQTTLITSQGPFSSTDLKDNVNAPTSTTSHSTQMCVTHPDVDGKTKSSTSTETTMPCNTQTILIASSSTVHSQSHDASLKKCDQKTMETTRDTMVFTSNDGSKSLEKRNRPTFLEDYPPAIKEKPNSMVTITFYALLPPHLWEWDEKSEVYIKFSDEALGNWKHDFGPMKTVKETEEFLELKYEMKVNYCTLSNMFMQYKYFVYTPKTVHDTCAEHLYCTLDGVTPEHANRVLSLKVSGDLCQYDTIIVPRNESSLLGRIKKLSSRYIPFFSSNSTSFELDIGDATMVRKKCLEVYLHERIKVLQKGINNTAGDEFVTNVCHIYKCVSDVLIQYESIAEPKLWNCKNLEEAMKHLLLSAIDYQANTLKEIVPAALIICCFQKLKIDGVDYKIMSDLLSLVISYPDKKTQQFNVLKALIDQNTELRYLLCNGIERFCEKLLLHSTSNYLVIVWKGAFLIHIIGNGCKGNFSNTNNLPESILWTPSDSNHILWELLKSIKGANLKPKCSTETYYGLESWFKLDPQFLPNFIYCWSSNAYEYLFTTVDPFYSISRVASILKTDSNWNLVDKWLSSISIKIRDSDIHEQNILHAAEYLIESLTNCDTTSHYPSMFFQGISLILQVYSLPVYSANNVLPDYEKLTFYLTTYVRIVIGGHIFGYKISSSGKLELEKSQKELDMWNSLLSLQCSDEIKIIWESVIEKMLLLRIRKLQLEWKLDLLFKGEARKRLNKLLMDIITKEAYKSLQSIVCNPESGISCETKKKIEKSDAMSVLLEKLIVEKYSNSATSTFSIDDILKWDLWPTIIKAYVRSKSTQQSGFTSSICCTAYNIVVGICSSVHNYSVTIGVLETIKEKEESMNNLNTAATSGKKSFHPTDAEFSKKLSTCLKMYAAFMSQHNQLYEFNRHLQTLKISGLETLGKELLSDITATPISKLCTIAEDGQTVITSFKCAEPILHILPKFITLSTVHTFLKFWNAQIQKFQSQEVDVSKFFQLVWEPVFIDCCRYLESLKEKTIKLTSVDELLDQYSEKDLEIELCLLEERICKCNDTPSNPSWIKPCVQRMQHYRLLRQYASTAKTILKLKEILALTGNFKLIEAISVKYEQSLHDQSLQFSDDFIETGEFLREISANKSKLKSLEIFASCQELINWIKRETKDINDLHQFITIALANACGGEDDYARDALSNLRTVCRGYFTLIYHLPTNTGYKELPSLLIPLWESLKRNPSLPEKLNDCGKQIEWYKSIKEMQGSVEKTTRGQMNNINKYGCYTVGSDDEAACSNLSKLIYLHLQKCHKKGAQQRYSMDELKDLESKLVLIMGKESDEKEHYEKVFNTVCHIAEVLIQLQQHGHSQYVGWVLKFPCNLPDTVDKLTKILKKMTKDLEDWQKKVDKAREKFYCLNYYTTQQLLMLRKELHHIRNSDDINADALCLLQSISINVTADLIYSLLIEIGNEDDNSWNKEKWDEFNDKEDDSPALFNITSEEVHNKWDKDTQDKVDEHEFSSYNKITPTQETVESAADSIIAHPKLTKNDLTDKQRGIFDNLKNEYNFPDKLILLAFDHSGMILIEEKVMRWCINNEKEYMLKFPDDNEDDQEQVDTDQPLEDTFHVEALSVEPQGYPAAEYLILDRKYADINEESEYLFSKATHETESLIEGQQILSADDDVTGFNVVHCESTDTYLSLMELVKLLAKLNKKAKASSSLGRNFHKMLKQGEPNLIVVAPDQVLKTVLSLYIEDKLPTYEEVLICNETTTTEEVSLLWKRAMGDPNYLRMFCLVHAEKLPYQICDNALKALAHCSQGKTGYKIAIVCSDEDLAKSHIVSELRSYTRPYSGNIYHDKKFSEYLFKHFSSWPSSTGLERKASDVDPDKTYVRVVTSERAGMGKSLFITNMKNELKRLYSNKFCYVIIPVHGPKVSSDSIVKSLKKSLNESSDSKKKSNQLIIFHFDIASSVLRQIDCVLFSLLILQAISDSQGRVWRCHPAHYYAIEITILKKEKTFARNATALLDIMPRTTCMPPKNCEKGMTVDMIQHLQRVYHYLKRYMAAEPLDGFNFKPENVENCPSDCVDILLNNCGVRNPSWSELSHFATFLDYQLSSCENSVFCNSDVLPGFKMFAVKFMIQMSKDFSTSSLKGEVSADNQELGTTDEIDDLQIDERKLWDKNYHPYLFFNQDETCFTFVGFNVTPGGDLYDPVNNKVIEYGIMKPILYESLKTNMADLSENYQTWSKDQMIRKICSVMGLEKYDDPDPTYVLTVDNVIKIMAIHMRFRCNIPVILMGETGCGKTRLIKYMCDLAAMNSQGEDDALNIIIMKIHGGTSEADVIKNVKAAEKIERKNSNNYTVLFFDEANTCDAIGLIKEVMCDRRVNGRKIKSNVKFIAACNPYKKHTQKMISKLESAGLGFYVKETQQKLGKIPLRQLVYRVLDLPSSMRPLVYDFGQLNDDTEKAYTSQIVQNRCQCIPEVRGQLDLAQSIEIVLDWSQKYMKKRKDECSFVSLRDVERAMLAFSYFCQKKDIFIDSVYEKAEKEKQQPVDYVTRSLILAVSVCYHARLQERKQFEDGVVKQFTAPLMLIEQRQFSNEIRWCQDVLLDNMKLGDNIARNAALRENVFMMVICIELRIPLFLVGKPGSSKSLAKSIVAASMSGKTSNREILRKMKEVQIFSYQCSQLSTSESVIEVFNTAQGFQNKQDASNLVSVVVLDEVGLAEDSPNLPLKALHPLLEDGTEGADESQQIIAREQRVAFIGISNWALDPAKMNRGVMVTRGDPDVTELELSARGICSNFHNDPVRDKLAPFFKPLSAAYKEICDQQAKCGKSFFGLRDFYSLIKMLYWMCKRTEMYLTGHQLQHAIKRNFGGFDSKVLDTEKIFRNYLQHLLELKPNYDINDTKMHDLLMPDCSPLGLITKSLQTKEASWHGENRYLLFLTENYAALQVLTHYLYKVVGMKQERVNKLEVIENSEMSQDQAEPFILFGSSFPKDREYTQVCRNINKIKICMETGRMVILLNLDNLYESLYDLLNQYYIQLGGQRYVDLGLQSHKMKCRVHNNFKLILIAEKETVSKFPTPLINRLEKHFVLIETILSKEQKKIFDELMIWIKNFSEVNMTKFSVQDAFVGYQNDTPASVVFQATKELQKEWENFNESSEEWHKAVLARSKKILLQMASPDALVRLESTSLQNKKDKMLQIYYFDQQHGSLLHFLKYHLKNKLQGQTTCLLQVTTHSHLLSSQEVVQLSDSLEMNNQAKCYLLQEFDTEIDFTHKIGQILSNDAESLLIIQCDSGHIYGDLIACARYRIEDERKKAERCSMTHILLLIHLPHYSSTSNLSFTGFPGGAWISAHIDGIRVSSQFDLTPENAQNTPISQLFYSEMFHSETDNPVLDTKNSLQNERDEMDDDILGQVFCYPMKQMKKHKQCVRLYSCIQKAVMKTNLEHQESAASMVASLLNIIPQIPTFPIDSKTFYGALVKHIKLLLLERENLQIEKEWVLNEAKDARKLQSGGTFQNVLVRRLDEVIVPIFSAILTFIDQFSNFSLIEETRNKEHIKQLWLQIFSNEDLVKYSYETYATTGTLQHGQELGIAFKCQFPFFWLIKEAIDSSLEMIGFTLSFDYRKENHTHLCHMLCDSPIAVVLNNMPKEYSVDLCKLYLSDVIKNVHYISHHLSKEEYEILSNALFAIISDEEFHHSSLLSYLVAIHVVYHEYQNDIMWFGQLTSIIPGILSKLATQEYDHKQFKLPLLAVRVAISPDNLALPLDSNGREYIPQRLVRLQLCQNIIDSILSLKSCQELAHEIRIEWQRVKVIQLFIEHVAMNCSMNNDKFIEFVRYAKRINELLLKWNNVAKKETIMDLRGVLQLLDGNFMKIYRSKPEMQKKIRKCSKSYFIEVVSSLCFGQPIPPDDDLIKELLNVVFAEGEEEIKTKEFSFSEKESTDNVPVIRSFLLQLLLEHRTDIVKDQLIGYFNRAQQLFQNDSNLYLLCIQCFEDAIYKHNIQISLARKVQQCHTLFEKGEIVVSTSLRPHQQISFEYLEGVAMLRYSFTVIAELIHNQYLNGSDDSQSLIDKAKKFLQQFSDESGSGVFLAKLLAKNYGMSFLTKITNDPSMQWVLPASFYQTKVDQQCSDPFIIYDKYKQMRALVNDAAYENQYQTLETTIKALSSCDLDIIYLLLGAYQVVTGSAAYVAEANKVNNENRSTIMKMFRKFQGKKEVAEHLMKDSYCGTLEPMTIRPRMNPQNRLLTDLVVHVAIVMQQYSSVEILVPFIQMINNPEELKIKYLPTMPEDPLPNVRNAFIDQGQFYECPKGHPYFIGDCGRPWMRSICPECQSPIGGTFHNADKGNKIARNTDNTETGYALGQPNDREKIPTTERSLSPSACAIIRALMHCSLLWSSCTNEHASQSLLDIIKTKVKPAELSLFFWQHLKHDINMLRISIGKSEDDACLLVHLILKHLGSNSSKSHEESNSRLETKEQRNDWEKCFFETYIHPILLNLDVRLHEAYTSQLNDKKKDKDRLFFVIHEREELPSEAITPHLWNYRSRITLEHLLQVLQTHKDTYPILHEFLIQEPMLRATQYIPSIIKLQQQMHKWCHRKLDKKDVMNLTIRAYMEGNLRNTKSIKMFAENLNCLKKAWMLAKGKLKDQARIPLDASLIQTVIWDEDTPLSCLIPTLTGDGTCTTALVHLLVGVHNDFLEKCQKELKKGQKKDTYWRARKIPVSHAQSCHLLDYENQIISIVLSHCQYSLEYGKGQKVKYDLPALEKHLVDRFIHGKPFVQLELLQVVYRKDVYTAEVFAKIRKNVNPQIQLTGKQQADIVNELGSMQRLRDCLDVVEIVIGFLSSNKISANTHLRTYITRILKMEKHFKSNKALQYCTLGHILSLWETISVKMAKCLTFNKQEPFDAFSEILLKELQDDQKQQLSSYLRGIELTPFLNLLYEFIETTVRHSEVQNSIDCSLRDILLVHLEQLGLDEILPRDFSDKFPESVTVGQSVATWKAIVFYQQAHEPQV